MRATACLIHQLDDVESKIVFLYEIVATLRCIMFVAYHHILPIPTFSTNLRAFHTFELLLSLCSLAFLGRFLCETYIVRPDDEGSFKVG